MLMSLSIDLRPTPDQLRGISFFQSAGALTLQYLDTLLQRPVDEKIQFFADLPNVLAELPSRVRTGLVLSSMQPEFANQKVLPTILPSVFKIIELSSGDEFVNKILPVIADLFSTNSPKGASIMIENLPLMLQKMTEAKKPEHIRNYLLPLLGKALAQEKQSHLQVNTSLKDLTPAGKVTNFRRDPLMRRFFVRQFAQKQRIGGLSKICDDFGQKLVLWL